MKLSAGTKAVLDDEWYTPYATALKVAEWAYAHLPTNTNILCPADILPDGSVSEIPKALHDVGFRNIRVTRDLPMDPLWADWNKGEVIITNPPFSLLIPFREWLLHTSAKYIVLSRPGGLYCCFPIVELGHVFYSKCGKRVATAWMQNFVDTRNPDIDVTKAIGNCNLCEVDICRNNYMTRDFIPRMSRALYGWGHAVRNGIAGWFCDKYTVEGKRMYSRFFNPSDDEVVKWLKS